MRARVVSVRGSGVRVPFGLGVDNEPRLDRVQVFKRRKDSAFPSSGDVASGNEIDERDVGENSL